jgi:hypothetical protein
LIFLLNLQKECSVIRKDRGIGKAAVCSAFAIVEYGAAVQTWRDCVLVPDGAVEIGGGRVLLFYLAHQPVAALESAQFFGVPQFC